MRGIGFIRARLEEVISFDYQDLFVHYWSSLQFERDERTTRVFSASLHTYFHVSQSQDLPVIGIVGGIGSGKSSVPRKLAERRSLAIIDADGIGHELLNESVVKHEIKTEFGSAVFQADGSVDRPALAAVVFGGTSKHEDAREALNSILHPRIRKEIHRRINEAKQSANVEAIILDAALLLESGWHKDCNLVVFVDVPRQIRQQRVIENRGWMAEELAKRELNQLPLEEKKARSNRVIDNGGSLEAAAEALECILNALLSDLNAVQN